jgi:hypothetical protein
VLGYPSNRSTTVSRDDAFPVMASPPWSFSGVLTSGASFSRAIRLGPVDEGFEAGRAAQLRSNGYPRVPFLWRFCSRSGGRRVGLKDFLVLQEVLRSWRLTSRMKRSMLAGMQ